ncbi:MAG: protein-methionine-sulfoxide reductase catalytic subunit MsrP [Pseudomonadota bacterium]|nr:protein-methionine-sulfoxide reductase catalytic subunit MsrP [Pseudomonadota bacterium]
MTHINSKIISKVTKTRLTKVATVSRRKALTGGLALAAVSTPLHAVLSGDTNVNSGMPSEVFSSAHRNSLYTLDRPLTPNKLVTTYNNFFEFGSHKKIWKSAQQLPLNPWPVGIKGLVKREKIIRPSDLLEMFPMEERWLRHRCVETWSMAVPWIGFPLKSLVEFAEPLEHAKYVKMTSFLMPKFAPGQRQHWLPWPYTESITIAEAKNPLAMIAMGMFKKPLPPQNGAPLRLVIPWKYGFKSIKSIQEFSFVAERPRSFWEELAGNEYGFWANVNPHVSHPRWSQKTEKPLGTKTPIATQMYNGYTEFVAPLYKDLQHQNLYR